MTHTGHRARDALSKHASGMFVAERGAIYDCDLALQGVKATAHVAGFDISEAARSTSVACVRAATPRYARLGEHFTL